jgi:hypothetical protein
LSDASNIAAKSSSGSVTGGPRFVESYDSPRWSQDAASRAARRKSPEKPRGFANKSLPGLRAPPAPALHALVGTGIAVRTLACLTSPVFTSTASGPVGLGRAFFLTHATVRVPRVAPYARSTAIGRTADRSGGAPVSLVCRLLITIPPVLAWSPPDAAARMLVYLDLDGHSDPNYNGSAITLPAFTGGSASREEIVRRLQEDFAPFDVTFTTSCTRHSRTIVPGER